jgi:hypothetical protein
VEEVTSMHNSVGTFVQEARKKGKPIIANPKAKFNHGNTSVQESRVKSRRPNPSMPNPKKNYRRQIPNSKKLGIAKAKQKQKNLFNC